MEFDKIDFVSAIDSLASLAGLEVPTEAEDQEAGQRKALYADQRRRSRISKSSEISSRSRTGSELSESTRTMVPSRTDLGSAMRQVVGVF